MERPTLEIEKNPGSPDDPNKDNVKLISGAQKELEIDATLQLAFEKYMEIRQKPEQYRSHSEKSILDLISPNFRFIFEKMFLIQFAKS